MQHHPGTTNWMVRCLAGSRITTREPQTEIACCLVVLILLHSRTTRCIELLELKSTTRRHKSRRFLSPKHIDPGGGEVGWGRVISQLIWEGTGVGVGVVSTLLRTNADDKRRTIQFIDAAPLLGEKGRGRTQKGNVKGDRKSTRLNSSHT